MPASPSGRTALPVQYVRTPDGFNIAFAQTGRGPDFVLMPYLFNDLRLTESPHALMAKLLERDFRLVCYDNRGSGLSTRGLDDHHTMAAYELDLETVVDRLSVGPFVLLATGFFGHVGLRYAVKHPERVRALLLWRSGVHLNDAFPHSLATSLAAENWDVFLDSFIAGNQANTTLTPEARRIAIQQMKSATTQQDWLASMRAVASSTVEDDAPQVNVPTLVLSDAGTTLTAADAPARLAALIPGARLIAPAAGAGPAGIIEAIQQFLAGLPGEAPATTSPGGDLLSAREAEVLRLIAAGRSNAQIAEALVISPNTVGRHVSNIFDKIGAANRAEATAYALRQGLA
jgi:DNA-binding NarL/FixJ family response regulator